jgi:hypothetical protein
METFKNAQKFFRAYQKNGRFRNLRDSLDILDELIERQGTDSLSALNFKQIIGRHIDTKLDEIYVKSNVDEFGKHLNNSDAGFFLFEALSKEDLSRFVGLSRIKKDYFK